MMMAYSRARSEPFKRVGLCCGEKCRARKHQPDVVLYLVREHRYRCRDCYRRETGFWPA